MKKTFKITLLFIIFMLLILGANKVNAASASISASKTNVNVGDNVTITVTINAAAWDIKVSGSGISDSIVGYNEDAVNETKTKTYTLNTSQEGSYTVSISGNVTDANDTKTYPNGSTTVTVSKPVTPDPTPTPEPEPTPTPTPKPDPKPNTNTNNTTNAEEKKSSDADLKAINVEGYTLTPEFSPNIKEYTLSVPNEVTSLNITAVKSDSKATYRSSGDEDLKVGENEVLVNVRAEDGTRNVYKIIVTRAKPDFNLSSLKVTMKDENGEIIELPLNPGFSFDIFEYKLEDISYKIDKLDVEAIANLEEVIVEIEGNEKLKAGENKITIIVKMPKAEGEETLEETKTYTITVNKEKEPVAVAPSATQGTIKYNKEKITAGALLVCAIASVGLTIYFIIDYKKYQALISKIAELNELNEAELATSRSAQINKEPVETELNKEAEKQEEAQEENITKKTGRHF